MGSGSDGWHGGICYHSSDKFPDRSVALGSGALRHAITCPPLESAETADITRWISVCLFTSIVWWVSSHLVDKLSDN